MKKILVIDNYDSFVFNLVHYLEAFGCKTQIKRNNELELAEVEPYDKILLSPGPGLPKEAGLLKQIVKKYAPVKSILGVCLGHQAIVEVFGGKLINPEEVFHGVSTEIQIPNEDEPLFNGLPKKISVGRYHSWRVSSHLPPELEATSFDKNGYIMSLRHKTFDLLGVQFHPESILTPFGKKILQNWVEY